MGAWARAALFMLAWSSIACRTTASEPASPCEPGFDAVSATSTCAPHFDDCGELAVPILGGGCANVGVPSDKCAAGFTSDARGGCVATLPAATCTGATMAVPGDSACRSVGVATCTAGFESDGRGGCKTTLPTACADGELATPGDTTCRPIVDCASDPYGSPTGASILYVDASSTATPADGSKGKPFTTIQEAVDAAPDKALSTVAIAAGTYAENVVADKPVQLVGRCPKMVTIRGGAGIALRLAADGSGVRGVAVTGNDIGIHTEAKVTIDATWVHDAGGVGIRALTRGPLTLTRTVVQRATFAGVMIRGVSATLDQVVVRDTRPLPGGPGGRGVSVEDGPAAKGAADVTITASLVDGNVEAGLLVSGSRLSVERSLIRGTRSATDGTFGRGIHAQVGVTKARAQVTVRGSVLEGNAEAGIGVWGSVATVEATTIRDTAPRKLDGSRGWGVSVEYDPGKTFRGEVTLRGTLVDRASETGIFVDGSVADIEDCVVRDTAVTTKGTGFGVAAQGALLSAAELTLRGSLVDGATSYGVYVVGSTATLERTAVRGTHPRADLTNGRGVVALLDPAFKRPSTVTLHACHVERNSDAGIAIGGSKLEVVGSVLRDTATAKSTTATGSAVIGTVSGGAASDITIDGSILERNAGSALVVSGGSLTVSNTVVRDTKPTPSGAHGRALDISADAPTGVAATLVVRASLFERCTDAGILVEGAAATIEDTLVRDISPSPAAPLGGIGITAQVSPTLLQVFEFTVRRTLVQGASLAGIGISGANGVIEASVIRGTRATDGRFGDGIAVTLDPRTKQPASLQATAVLLVGNARSGASAFGAELSVASSLLSCNALDIDLEDTDASDSTPVPGHLADGGGNACGCETLGPCLAGSSGLEPIVFPR